MRAYIEDRPVTAPDGRGSGSLSRRFARLPAGWGRIALALAVAAALGACTEVADQADIGPGASACVGCHGDETGPAPTDPIHQAHLTGAPPDGSVKFTPVECDTCHQVPYRPTDPGHIDTELPAEVRLVAVGPDAAYDPGTRTCSGVSCHGGRLASAPASTPAWDPDVTPTGACTTCHGNPPGGDHPVGAECGTCHAVTNPALHGNGKVDFAFPDNCTTCHGGPDGPAPVDGVHQAHLAAEHSRPVVCATCHVVPPTVTTPGHLGPPPAEITFAGLADGGGSTPTFHADTVSCSGTYCHSSRPGGVTPAPVWEPPLSGQDPCTGCHGNPPPAPHPQNTQCQLCHAPVAGPGGIAIPGRHVDGHLDVTFPTKCNACHGGASGPAPEDLGHKTHLGSTIAHVACESCHVVPATVTAVGHLDSAPPAEVTFKGVAVAGGATPTLTGKTCAATWCHKSATVDWGAPPAGAGCAGCHGAPPTTGDHPAATQCHVCHSEVAGPGLTILNTALHVDGKVQVTESPSCSACHGDSITPAPATGAHRKHIAAGVSCDECHVVPTNVLDTGHVDTALPAEVTFGDIATTDDLVPVWDPVQRTCSSTYCHGGAGFGGTLTTPSWDATDGAAAACGACHSLPPPPNHPAIALCLSCHKNTLHTKEHVDGKPTFKF